VEKEKEVGRQEEENGIKGIEEGSSSFCKGDWAQGSRRILS